MPPTRSEAAAAAAPATTRSGRVKQVSAAALSSVANENREAQQARRARTGGKSTRRNGANARGQTVASGTPTVSISSRTAQPRQAQLRRRSPLGSLNSGINTSQPAAPPQSSLALPRYSNTQTPASLAPPTAHGEHSATALSLNVATAANRHRDLRERTAAANRTASATAHGEHSATDLSLDVATAANRHRDLRGRTAATNHTTGDNTKEMSEEGEGEDGDDRSGGGGWRDDEDGSDDGGSDRYIPSEADDGEEDGRDGGDNMEVDRRSGGDIDEDVDEEEGGNISIRKKRAPRHSKKATKTAPKASDYAPEVESLLNHAAGIMRALVVAENPMPSVDESITLATDAFETAKFDRPHVNFPDDIAHISILRRCIPQVRGKIKDAARAKVGDAYGFDDRPSMQQKNRRLYLKLLNEDSYIYEKPETFDGPYYHPICFKTLKTCFFSKSTDDGVAFSEWFSPIRMETIALVFTAVRMCLDEWKSGSYKPLMFSSDVYEPVFKDHLANLKTMEKEDPLFVKGIGEELWEDCSEPFDLEKTRKPAASITNTHKIKGVVYGQERRNARAARKVAAASAPATASDGDL